MLRAFVLFTALLVLALDAPAESDAAKEKPPELPAWNQQEVADLGRKLQHLTSDLRDQERSAPQDSIASGQARARERYRDILRNLEDQCRKLVGRVEEGKSREDTAMIFNRIQEMGRDAAEEARRMFLARETLDTIQEAEAVTNQLRIFYRGSADPRPALVGPSKND
jgi:small-conductance mechanosensitive channel